MTTPAMSYYSYIIHRDAALRRKYRRHQWRGWYSANRITSFTLIHDSNIFEYRKGLLIFRKSPPNPFWNAPEEYSAPMEIPLTSSQMESIRQYLSDIPFTGMHTDPCSFVNLEKDCMISEHFVCKFRWFGAYEFADQYHSGCFGHLPDLLEGFFRNTIGYRHIQRLEREIFVDRRFQTCELPVIPVPHNTYPQDQTAVEKER